MIVEGAAVTVCVIVKYCVTGWFVVVGAVGAFVGAVVGPDVGAVVGEEEETHRLLLHE